MTDNIITRFLNYIKEKQLTQKGDKLLLAVSGGSDSMVLSDLFYRTGFSFGIAHCNFKLREKDAERDEAFTEKYASEIQVPFHVIRFDTKAYAAERGLSIEEAARELRYNWFEEIRKQYGYTFVATAHHQNDNVETLLLNFFKGTGIRGLHGIPPKNGRVIRPMLFMSKEEVKSYIHAHHITYVEDVTNASTVYTRNYLRHHIIPELEKRFPDLINQMNGNIQRFSEAEELYRQAVEAHRKKLIERNGTELFIPILKLKKSRPLNTVAYEIFKDYNFSYKQSQQILALMDKEPGRMVYSATHQLLRDRKWFILSPVSSGKKTQVMIEENNRSITVENIRLTLTKVGAHGFVITPDASVAALDADKITFPLQLRKWKPGDYFYPLGMRKKKKLSRFFIDLKLSLFEKEKIWVLLSGPRILWVVGLRIDDRFKVTKKTQRILKIICKAEDH